MKQPPHAGQRRAFAILVVVVGCSSPPSATPAGAPKTVKLGAPTGDAVAAPAMPGANVPAIKVNTVGYPIGWRKVVVFNRDPSGATITDAAGKVVLTITTDMIEERGIDAASKDPVWQVDVSALDRAGTYRAVLADTRSDPFAIAKAPYDRAVVAGAKSFYFQRTRTALEAPHAIWDGDHFTRKNPSHVHEDVGWDLEHYPDKKHRWQVDAGWHDAGNYDMYVPSTAPSAQALLMAYAEAPDFFEDGQLSIPESGNGIPDLLDEARWGLRWVLSMQETGGAFRHREAVMEWSPAKPADEDRSVRWIAGVSSAATAKAVASLALASRIYRPWDPEFAGRCAAAAKKGWAFLLAHPKRIRARNKGSKQPLWDDEPGNTDVGARLLAGAAMWREFRDRRGLALARELMSAKETSPKPLLKGAWVNLSRWALLTLARDEKTPAELRQRARSKLVAAAKLVRDNVETRDGYRCASGLDDYYWGHNSTLLSKVHLLAAVAKLAPSESWMLEAARDQWHWILGRNPNGYSMVTRVGKGPTRMYHMEWGAKEPPPPGFVLGGPNASEMGFLAPDAPAKALLWDNPEPLRSGVPAHGMWHWQQSDLWDGGFVPEGQWTAGWWAVTEPDILYSANFVLAGASLR